LSGKRRPFLANAAFYLYEDLFSGREIGIGHRSKGVDAQPPKSAGVKKSLQRVVLFG